MCTVVLVNQKVWKTCTVYKPDFDKQRIVYWTNASQRSTKKVIKSLTKSVKLFVLCKNDTD